MLLSMTGYGEASYQSEVLSLALELRSLNNRYLKVSLRAPEPYNLLEPEVEKVVRHLKAQGTPQYLEAVTAAEDEEDEDGNPVFDATAMGEPEGADLYQQAVQVVLRDRKASTSYIQRRLQIGYNRAASLMERMEKEGVVGQPNHAGKREILIGEEDAER